jgi:hypothetical protein
MLACASGQEAPGIQFTEPKCQVSLEAGALHVFAEVQKGWAYSKNNSKKREAYDEAGELYLNASSPLRLGATDGKTLMPDTNLALSSDVDVTQPEFAVGMKGTDYWVVTVGECTPEQRALGLALAAFSLQKL